MHPSRAHIITVFRENYFSHWVSGFLWTKRGKGFFEMVFFSVLGNSELRILILPKATLLSSVEYMGREGKGVIFKGCLLKQQQELKQIKRQNKQANTDF